MIPSRWLSTQGISVFQCLRKVKTIPIFVASEKNGADIQNWSNDDDDNNRHKACLGQHHFQSVYFF